MHILGLFRLKMALSRVKKIQGIDCIMFESIWSQTKGVMGKTNIGCVVRVLLFG